MDPGGQLTALPVLIRRCMSPSRDSWLCWEVLRTCPTALGEPSLRWISSAVGGGGRGQVDMVRAGTVGTREHSASASILPGLTLVGTVADRGGRNLVAPASRSYVAARPCLRRTPPLLTTRGGCSPRLRPSRPLPPPAFPLTQPYTSTVPGPPFASAWPPRDELEQGPQTNDPTEQDLPPPGELMAVFRLVPVTSGVVCVVGWGWQWRRGDEVSVGGKGGTRDPSLLQQRDHSRTHDSIPGHSYTVQYSLYEQPAPSSTAYNDISLLPSPIYTPFVTPLASTAPASRARTS